MIKLISYILHVLGRKEMIYRQDKLSYFLTFLACLLPWKINHKSKTNHVTNIQDSPWPLFLFGNEKQTKDQRIETSLVLGHRCAFCCLSR